MVFRFSGKNKTIVAGLLCSVALLVALSACGSGSQESATGSQKGAATGPAQEIKVEMGDFFYRPNEITLKAGKVRFVLTNVGKTAHRFGITGEGVNVSTKNVLVGREGVLEIELAPGTYKLLCNLGDHEKQGSVGKLTVQ